MKNLFVTISILNLLVLGTVQQSAAATANATAASSSTYECVYYVIDGANKVTRSIGHLLTDEIKAPEDGDVGSANRVLGLPMTVGSINWPDANVIGFKSVGNPELCVSLSINNAHLSEACGHVGDYIHTMYEPENGYYKRAVVSCYPKPH